MIYSPFKSFLGLRYTQSPLSPTCTVFLGPIRVRCRGFCPCWLLVIAPAAQHLDGRYLHCLSTSGRLPACSQTFRHCRPRLQMDVRPVLWFVRHSPSKSNFVHLCSQETSRRTMEGRGILLIWLGALKTLGKRPIPALQGPGSRICSVSNAYGLAEAPRVQISSNGASVLRTSPHVL